MVTVSTRSAAAGMAIGLGYYFAEGILIALLSAFFQWFDKVADYLLIRNINVLAGGGFGFGPGGAGTGEIGTVQASFVLAVYTVMLAGMAIGVFQRRDVTGASGG
jgi:ABC-type transport system involved in multi-copper enzyme maturation permease subunit